jgi:hypothetical protein
MRQVARRLSVSIPIGAITVRGFDNILGFDFQCFICDDFMFD